MKLPRGAYAPVPTPLDSSLGFDADAQRAHLQWLAAEGLEGALVLGTNGEFPSLSLAERRVVAEAAAAVHSGLALMLGVGSCALPEVLEMVAVAADCGYDSVLCPPPFYFRAAPARGIADFFVEVLDRSELPVLLYHIPQVSGVAITDELLDLVGDHENLAGVKDSSGSVDELARLAARFSGRAHMVGNDLLLTTALAGGGTGSITAAASVAPALVVEVHRGQAEQATLDKVRTLLEAYGLGPSVKALLRRAGLGKFATRPPLRGLDPDRADALWEDYCALVSPANRPTIR